jgi:class 3 adenylate cyclase/CHASE2 domain-containing sensor protein
MQKYSELTTKQKLSFLFIIIVIFLVVSAFNFLFNDFFKLLNYKVTDTFFSLRYQIKGKEKIDPKIIHIDLNDSSIEKLKISEFDRSVYGRVINVLTKTNVKDVAFDIIFTGKREKEKDDVLLNAVKESGRVFLAVSPQTEDTRKTGEEYEKRLPAEFLIHPVILKTGNPPVANTAIINFEELMDVAKGAGHISIDPDEDGVFRRIPLLYKYNDGYIPDLTFSMVLDYLNVKSENIEVSFGDKILIKNAHFPLGINKDISIPVDSQGRVIINFAGTWNNTFYHTDFAKILESENDQAALQDLLDQFEDSLVIISDVTTRGKDHGTVPVEKVYPKSGLHSNLINSILTNSFIVEPDIFILIFVNLIFAFLLWLFSIRGRAVGFTILSLALFAFYVVLSFVLFLFFNILMPLVYPSISLIFTVITVILAQYFTQQKNYIKHILKLNEASTRFVPQEFLHFLGKDDITDAKLGDQIHKEMTVLFSDIRSFTTLSEKMTPEENFDFINSYLSTMGPVIRENNGFIDKYIGDAIMALFPDGPLDAIKASIKMQEKLREYNKNRNTPDKQPIAIGIGVNTGYLMLGIIGENERFDGSVISDSVNLASRLEGLTKYYGAGFIISEFTLRNLPADNQFTVRFLDRVKVKGKKEPVSIYEVLDGETGDVKKIKLEVDKMIKPAIDFYLKKDFEKALTIFNDAIKKYPEEKLLHIYKDRSDYFLKNGVPDNWDGTVEIKEK